MARIYPDRPRSAATKGERRTFESLRALDDAWYVLHSVGFVAREGRGNRPGEADFVLLHPRLGMIVLEVKDGRYRVAGRQWYESRASGWVPIARPPFDQATDNRYKLRAYVRDATGIAVPTGHCVVFTAG